MSHAFKNIRDSVSQGDFLTNKKSILTYCDSNSRYNKITTATSYNQLYLYNNTSRRIVSLQRKTLYSKYDLINGQYSKMNLLGVCAAIPSTIKASNLNFWLNNGKCAYCVDPSLASNKVKINVNNLNNYIDGLGNEIVFYQFNTLDPEGQLFGNSRCSELNIEKYMVSDVHTI